MKYVFQCIGTIILSIIIGIALVFVFTFITKLVMGVGWFWFIVYLLFAGGLLTGLIGSIATLLATPVNLLMGGNIVAKVLNAGIMIYYGFQAVCLPWKVDMDFGVLQYLLAISLSITFFTTFAALVGAPFTIENE